MRQRTVSARRTERVSVCEARLTGAVVGAVAAAAAAMVVGVGTARAVPITVGNIQTNPAARVTAYPLASPPINGFTPLVTVGLTDEQDRNGNYLFGSVPSSSPGGLSLPVSEGPRYFVGTFDTGSSSHIVSYADAQVMNLEGAGRLGTNEAQIAGATGTEYADISDALGVYVTGFGSASVSGGAITVAPGSLKGQWNTSILTAQQGSSLPSLIGAPMVAQYQATIQNSQTRRLQVGETKYRSPQVGFQGLNTALPGNFVRLTLTVQSPQGNFDTPSYFPDVSSNNWADNPSTPTFWEAMFAKVNAVHTAGSISNERFLFDTGAQVTVLSQDTAAQVGIYSAGPNATTPDFTVEVTGVGGAQHVPGYYLNELSVVTNGGPIKWTHVPVIVLDLIDPGTGTGFVPGILGMNLFTDRDLIVNGGTSNPFVGISPLLSARWATNADGNWGDDVKWVMGVPDGEDLPANFLSDITAPRTITVDGNYDLGSMKFDNVNRYTIAGPGRLTLKSTSGQAPVEVVKGSHTIAAPMTFATDARVSVDRAGDTLTFSGGITAGNVATVKAGPGVMAVSSPSVFGAVAVEQGKLALTAGQARATRMAALAVSAGASVDLNGGLVVGKGGGTTLAGLAALAAAAHDGGRWDLAGLTSSAAAADAMKATGIGLGDNAVLGYVTFDGLSVSATDLLLKYTWYGDANLDGKVDGADRGRLASIGGAATWMTGDFNYDGVLTADDFALFQLGAAMQTGGFPMVPEPGVGLVAVIAGVGVMGRRRRGDGAMLGKI